VLPFYPDEERQDGAHNNTTQYAEENDDGERRLELPEKKRDSHWSGILHREYGNDQYDN
jgi:hypothetical protein